MITALTRAVSPTNVLAQLIDSPDLVQRVKALPPRTFSSLVRHIGIEDAGEIVALATMNQLVAAFDEDLFVNEKPGEREVFDVNRFILWLQVLLEAGEEVAARRVSELSENFLIHALSKIILVLDHDALMLRMSEGGHSASLADKALESSLSEELDGYLLVSRLHDGWDAVLSLILALDRDYRSLLEQILNQCVVMSQGFIDDLDELTSVLSAADSLAEDVEAEREERRSKAGHVEPRAARSFLSLARMSSDRELAAGQRDPITRAYFRDIVERMSLTDVSEMAFDENLDGLLPPPTPSRSVRDDSPDSLQLFIDAFKTLRVDEPRIFAERMEELTYLVNVVVAGAHIDNRRFLPSEAAEAALVTVAFGAALESHSNSGRATTKQLLEVLRARSADLLFRRGSRECSVRDNLSETPGFLLTREELLDALTPSTHE